MENKCTLSNKIDHGKVEARFKGLVFCPLFEKEADGGMVFTGTLCSNCCIRTQMVGEALADLILRQEITIDDLKKDPQSFYSKLPPKLRGYAETVSREAGKTWAEIKNECQRCKPAMVKPLEVPEAEATEMTPISQRGL